MHYPSQDSDSASGGNLNNRFYQNSHIASQNTAASNPRKPNPAKLSNAQGIHFSRNNVQNRNRNDSTEYVYPDAPQPKNSNLRTLGFMNKLQTGQVLRPEYGIYDYAVTKEPRRKEKDSNNWFSNITWKILLGLALLIIVLLAITLAGVIVFFKSSKTRTKGNMYIFW